MNAHWPSAGNAAPIAKKACRTYCGPDRYSSGIGRNARGGLRGIEPRDDEVSQDAFGRHHHPTASASATPTASGSATASATATPSASASATGTAAAVPPATRSTTAPSPLPHLGDLATTPVDGTGAAINMNQTAAQAAASMNCSIAVPANPLTATGLATPWQLGDGCSMANAGTEGAFVEATILAPNGSLQVYSPLVVTAGTQPAVAPTPPTIAAGSSVIIDVGFNGTNLVLTGAGAQQGNCVDASGQSVIGQVSACNAVNFYNAANAAIASGTLKVPAVGTASDGQACQTTRDFALIDQDQSDNVVSQYLINANGQTAQNSPANTTQPSWRHLAHQRQRRRAAERVRRPGERLHAVHRAGHHLPEGRRAVAGAERAAGAGRPAGYDRGRPDERRDDAGRREHVGHQDQRLPLAGRPAAARAEHQRGDGRGQLLQNMANIAPARNNLDMAKDAAFGTPVADAGNNLATFLGNRLSMSFTNLNCSNFGLTNPVTSPSTGTASRPRSPTT